MSSENKYTIIKNDCLSLLAKKWNVTVDLIVKSNSDLIKNPDLIFEGDKLNIPKAKGVSNERWPLITPPECKSEKVDTCNNKRPMEDILYVPADPISGKKRWYSVTAEAKQKILEEKQKMADAIVEGDAGATKKNLRAAGLLSKFEQKSHEQFLETLEEREQYKALIIIKLTIESDAFSVDGRNPNEVLISIAEVLDYNLAQEFKNKLVTKFSRGMYQIPASELARGNELKVNRALRIELLKIANRKISQLEQKAKSNARGKTAIDGTQFVYMEKLKFYTTEQQKKVLEAIKRLNGSSRTRRKKESDLMFYSPAESTEYLSDWKENIRKSWDDLNGASQLAIVRRNDKYFYDAQSIHTLNLNGYAIKEQCLTPKQLFGDFGTTLGPKALSKVNWRQGTRGKAEPLDIANAELIDELYLEVAGQPLDSDSDQASSSSSAQRQQSINSSVITAGRDWAYFPTLALIALIDATVSKYKQELTQLLNTGQTPIDTLFSKLLWVKQIALARLDALNGIAKANAEKGVSALQFHFALEQNLLPKSLNLIWEENKFKPKRVNNSGYRNKAGYNDLQIVECVFVSDGEVFYLRGPAWYLPGDDSRLISKSNGHVVNITSKVQFAAQGAKGAQGLEDVTVKEALKKLFNKPDVGVSMGLLPLKVEQKSESTFWQDSYHYQEGLSPDGASGAYSVDAGVQFLRFAAQGEAQLNSPLDSYSSLTSKTKQIGSNGAISASFVALQGQLGVEFCFPLQEGGQSKGQSVKPYELVIEYVDKLNVEHKYSAGFFYALVKGQVYGLAGATCSLSAGITVGPTDVGEGIGIRGNTIDLFSPNIVDVRTLNGSNLATIENAKLAAEASVKGDIFAGVEAGGILSAETFWFPPIAKSTEKSVQGGNQQQNEEIASYDPKNKLKLAAISGKASVAAGAGASGEFGVKIQGGVFIFTAQAKAVFGIGCSGSVDLELNGESLNEFVDCLLGVLKKSEFRRLSAFGEVDANGINQDFEHLNDLLTIATALGLTFAKAILLPFDVWQDYKKQALSKEYAPFLASKINTEDPKLKRNMQRWMVKMPPETLANLLNVLCQKQSGSLLNYRDDVIDAKTDNLNQANAIIKIMEWLANDSAETNDTNQRQWKETLISMAGVNKAEKNKLKEWQGYQDSWFKLANFVQEISSSQSVVSAEDLEILYSNYSIQLGRNMVLIKEESMASISYTISIGSAIKTSKVAYRVYPYSVVEDHDNGLENDEYVKLDSDAKVTRTRITWSFADVEL